MLKVSSISKNYGNVTALNKVSFSLSPGKVYGFVGPNGAGKTTAMRIITGYLKPDDGDVLFSKRSILTDRKSISSEIGYLPENNPLYENMRVDEFLIYINSIKGANRDDLKVIAVETGLTSVLNKEIGELSKGYRQRVGLAKAIIGTPKYLILDEPSTGLDPNQKNEMLSLIKKLGEEKTVLFSSHVLSEVESLADELLVINQGKLVAKGSTKEISSKHVNKNLIKLKLNKPSTLVIPKIKKIKSVKEVKFVNKQEDNFYQYEVYPNEDDKVNIDIFKTAVKEKWIISEIYREKSDLESIFRELTK